MKIKGKNIPIKRYAFLALFLTGPAAGFARDQDVREAIVKIYAIHNRPDYYNPWSMEGPRSSTGSGCIISKRRILTNAHVVSDETFIQVRRYGQSKRYQARVLSVSHHADLALLTVDDPSFFDDVEPMETGALPESQEEVHVYGFPLGGDTLSITKGVISRIEHQVYSHSSVHLLAGQIDAAINPGNSGGPVVLSNKIVGVVMQSLRQAENLGYMVPINIVDHFSADIEDGRYDGFPSLGVILQEMENPVAKRKYRMPETQSGVRVVKVVPGSAAEGYMQKGDVLLAVDGHDVADDGNVEFRPKERSSVSYYVQEHQVGDVIEVDVLRDGRMKKLSFPLSAPLEKSRLIPMEAYDRLPSYYIYGGVVFCPLNKNLMKVWGGNWYNTAPKNWLALLGDNYKTKERDEVVIALKVLAADVNEGYHKYNNWIIESVNGRAIRNLQELIEIVESDVADEFVVFSSDQDQEIVLDRQKVEASTQRILDIYRIPRDRSDDLLQIGR